MSPDELDGDAQGEGEANRLARVRPLLQALYSEIDAAVAAAGPVCLLSGRCCRFAEFGHTLFISRIEADLLVAAAGPPVRPLDDGATCPWQDERGRCMARDARPLGCRIYHCDPAYESTAGPELSERFLGRLKRIVREHGLAWDYAPLHRHLEAARDAGRLALEAAQAASERAGMMRQPLDTTPSDS